MLEAVRGTVESASDGVLQLNLGAVTLEFLVPAYFQPGLVPGDEVEVFTHFQLVNEGNRITPLAVAFPCPADRAFFRNFISVSGVGPRAASKALCHPPGAVASAIARGDHGFLRALPGIGAARAKQIIAKLQDSMSLTTADFSREPSCPGGGSEVLLVLKQLGLTGEQAAALVARALEETGSGADTQSILRAAMRIRSGG
jgi:Holliday junction resolvasome RuvABC DNA-binding subunit